MFSFMIVLVGGLLVLTCYVQSYYNQSKYARIIFEFEFIGKRNNVNFSELFKKAPFLIVFRLWEVFYGNGKARMMVDPLCG